MNPGRLRDGLARCLAWPLALLLLAEVAVLLAGVVARFGLHRPLLWSDELASLLFLWMTALGAALALHRGAHLRMTAWVMRAGPSRRAVLERAVDVAVLAFCLASLQPAWAYAAAEAAITTPALAISHAWRAAALPVGLAAMALSVALRLAAAAQWRRDLTALALLAAPLLLLWQAASLFAGSVPIQLLLFFGLGLGCSVAAGVPIAFAFGLASLGYLGLATQVPLAVLAGRMADGMSQQILLAVPLFVLLGLLIAANGMAAAMVALLSALFGRVRGGLSYVLVAAMFLVSGISGSKAADMAAVAPALFPEMKRRGSRPGDLAALLAATGAQTETVPPSLVLIVLASVTGLSVAALFTAGLLPALLLGAILCGIVWWRHRHAARPVNDLAERPRLAATLLPALPALALPLLIRGAVAEGVATATEVATVGIAYAVLVGALFYRRMAWREGVALLLDTASLSAAVLLIVGTATAMAWCLNSAGVASSLAGWMALLPGGAAGFLAASVLVFIVFGALLEGIPAVLVLAPLLFPVARLLGIGELHYAMVAVLSMGLGLFSPPLGLGYYTACAIGQVDPAEALQPIRAYLAALLFGVVLVAALPWLSTALT